MKVNIGNLVLRRKSSDSPEWVPTRVNLTYLGLIAEFPEDYKPIPPTEETLLKAGATRLDPKIHEYHLGKLRICLTAENKWVEPDLFSNGDWVEIKGLHHLQNIYDDLHDKELEINL